MRVCYRRTIVVEILTVMTLITSVIYLARFVLLVSMASTNLSYYYLV